MASLMPLQRNISPYRGAPTLRQFDVDEFVASIEHSGPQLTSGVKGDWVGLYRSVIHVQRSVIHVQRSVIHVQRSVIHVQRSVIH